jgi:hypothetical protein
MVVRFLVIRALPPPPSQQGKHLVLFSVRGLVNPRAIVRLERLGQLINVMTPEGIETASFLACSGIPQPITVL